MQPDPEISLTIGPYPCIRIQFHGGVCRSMDLFDVRQSAKKIFFQSHVLNVFSIATTRSMLTR